MLGTMFVADPTARVWWASSSVSGRDSFALFYASAFALLGTAT